MNVLKICTFHAIAQEHHRFEESRCRLHKKHRFGFCYSMSIDFPPPHISKPIMSLEFQIFILFRDGPSTNTDVNVCVLLMHFR